MLNKSYLHTTQVNVAIHITCVPAILLTALLFVRRLSHLQQKYSYLTLVQGTNTPSIPLPPWLSIPNLPPNLGTIAAVVYSTLYVLMEPVAGGMLAPILIGGTAYANHLTTNYGMAANYIALGVHVFSWLAQFVGHGIFEGRAPALLDNLVQALFLAPFFVWMEILFMFGYRPELKARIDVAIQKDIKKFRDDAAAKKANGQVKSNGNANGQAN